VRGVVVKVGGVAASNIGVEVKCEGRQNLTDRKAPGVGSNIERTREVITARVDLSEE